MIKTNVGKPGIATYSWLFAPLDIGPVRLKNPVVMGSMFTRFEEQENGIERLAVYNPECARLAKEAL